jgi:glycosyltransferase involved in cell wall biosynthesis
VGLLADGVSGPGSGAWARLLRIGTVLTASGCRVTVLLNQGVPGNQLVDAGCTVVHTQHTSRRSRFLRRRSIAADLVSRAQLDVLHLETPPFRVGRPGAPVVATVHDLRYHYSRSSWLRGAEGIYQRLMLPRDLRTVDRVIAVSEWSRRDLVQRFGIAEDLVSVVPNGLNRPSASGRPSSEAVSLPSAPYVLALGHLESRKNLGVLVRAAADPKWPSGVGLVFAGRDAGAGQTLRAQAMAHGAPINFLGPVDEEAKWDLIRGALCVAVPSTIEGFGIVAIEAMSCETPVLLADTSALHELTQPGVAMLPPHDEVAWARAVGKISTEGIERDFLITARAHVETAYSDGTIGARLWEVYHSLNLT